MPTNVTNGANSKNNAFNPMDQMDMLNSLSGLDMNNLLDMNKQMQDEMNRISPEQKKQMDMMAKQMFGDINIDDMMKAMNGSNNNKTRKRRK